jgi:hypothetical protein
VTLLGTGLLYRHLPETGGLTLEAVMIACEAGTGRSRILISPVQVEALFPGRGEPSYSRLPGGASPR